MTRRVAQIYGLSGQLPFLNVDVDKDNRLFLDPSAIRNGKGKYASRADRKLRDFFGEVLTCARSSDPKALAKGERLLQSMHEPNENRLGYTKRGSKGHAFADEMGSLLWTAIRENRTLHSGTSAGLSIQFAVLSSLERVPLFIDRVDRDMISDLATRVTFDVLADFTADMMTRYPSLANGATTESHDVWNMKASDLIATDITLPCVDGKQLLLIPKGWVYWRTVMFADQFYNRYATQVIQDEQTTYDSEGKPDKPSKKGIKDKNRDKKRTNAMQASKYAEQHDRDLAAEYEAAIDADFEPLTDEEIERHLGK